MRRLKALFVGSAILLGVGLLVAGYAGWSPGQLRTEMVEGAWACVPGRAADVLAPDGGDHLWHRVLRRQTGPRAVLSTATPDPTQN